MTDVKHFWVVEYDGVSQFGHHKRYYALEQAEENFGAVPDKSGETYKLVKYVPGNEVAIGRDEALRLEGFDT